jgi:Tfp pilus assembly ATPase PilU
MERFLLREWLGNDPYAKLAVLQSGAKVGDKGLQQVLFGLIKQEKVCSPRDVANDADSRSADLRLYLQLSVHRFDLLNIRIAI